MTQIKVDAVLQAKLRAVTAPTELVDDGGKPLGQFLPYVDMSDWEPLTPEISEEELRRRELSNDWCSYEQIMEHLRKLGSS